MKDDTCDQIYQTYFDPVYRYVFSLSHNPHIAEDITQETFFKAMRSLRQFRGESSIKSWLCAIARNCWISEQRRKKPETLAVDAAVEDLSYGPEASVLMHDESQKIHRLVHALDEPYREIFTLRTLGQLSFRDIGELFGKSDNWACVVYHRAIAKIRSEMEEYK